MNLEILGKIMEESKLIGSPRESYFKDIIGTFLGEAQKNDSLDVFQIITERNNQIMNEINFYVSNILHDPLFSKLCESWTGLYKMVKEINDGADLKIKILNVNIPNLAKELSRVMDFDQSNLFKIVYEEEYGTFGGQPFSCLILDYYVERLPKSFDFLSKLSEICSAAHVPLITSVNPNLFDINSIEDIPSIRSLRRIFENEELITFNSLREREESQYISLVLPRVLGRIPYEPINNPAENLEFFVENRDTNYLLWHNAAFYMGINIGNAYRKYGWTSAIRGAENGGKVENLPIFKFKDIHGSFSLQCPVEISITDRREKELSDLGFIGLCYCKNSNYAVFFGAQTLNKPKIYNKPDATANAQLSARLPYVLNVCRFAHVIKSMMREKIGKQMTSNEVEGFLNNWISDYIILNSTSDPELCARYPLRGAKIQVKERPDNPGVFSAIIHLQPHVQMEGLQVSLRLVAELPKSNN